jgi:predicted nucleic acid-binding Zn ribbon protein
VRRRGPRPLSGALETTVRRVAPATTLAAAQERWRTAVGAAVAREAEPVAERDGVLTVACGSATWAHELELLSPELLSALNGALDRDGRGRPLVKLRVVTRASSGIGDLAGRPS